MFLYEVTNAFLLQKQWKELLELTFSIQINDNMVQIIDQIKV